MTEVDAASTSFPSSSSSSGTTATPKIFRLKRKIDDDPLSTLALSIKKSKKSNDAKIEQPSSNVGLIYDVLHLAASSSCPIAPEYSSNVDYHDLNIVDQYEKQEISDMEILSSDDENRDLDLHKIDPHINDDREVSSPKNQRRMENVVTCNGRPMYKIKKQRENDDRRDYVYDFYVPKNYNIFKDGLPDKITCRIDTENLIDGVISLNADNFDDDQYFPSIQNSTMNYNEESSNSSYFDPYYYRNERNIDRMYDSNLEKTDNQQKSVKFCDFLPEKLDWRREKFRAENENDDDDEDSNDENNYKNDYPDEDDLNFSDDDDDYYNVKLEKFAPRNLVQEALKEGEEEDEDLENYLDDDDLDLASKFDDFYLGKC